MNLGLQAESGIEWSDPPASAQVVKRADIGEALRRNPNRWAVISRHGSNAAAQQKARRVAAGDGQWSPAGAFQATFDPQTGTVYARFVGEST